MALVIEGRGFELSQDFERKTGML